MARAKPHYIPDQIWHITQRCHKREFLLKWRAGRTAQEYNRRKRRKGAFWEDRYYSTAIETGEHLLRCLVCVKSQ